mmetsp:Transcript_18830/g.40624  ORF Transcript_18830/g.40624 Transcript_18830/m.40624 type:complete len:333 (-) Transcript_18830:44-1042(-)
MIRHNAANLAQNQIRDLMHLLLQNASLRVPHRIAHHLLHRRLRLRQRPPVGQQPNHRVVLPPGLLRHDAQTRCHMGTTQHPVAHPDPMRNPSVPVGLLDRMREGVPVLEHHPLQVLRGVHTQNVHLRTHAQPSQLDQIRVLQCQALRCSPTALVEQVLRESPHKPRRMISAKQCRVLAQLPQAAQQLVLRQGATERQIHQDQSRCVVHTDVVLPTPMADRRLQRRRHIVHRQQGRGNVHQAKSSVNDASEKTRDVHQRSSPEPHDHRATCPTTLERPVDQPLQVLHRFALVTTWKNNLMHRDPRRPQRIQIRFMVLLNRLISHNQETIGVQI